MFRDFRLEIEERLEAERRPARYKMYGLIGALATEGVVAFGVAIHEAVENDTTGVVVATVAGAVAMVATGVGALIHDQRHS